MLKASKEIVQLNDSIYDPRQIAAGFDDCYHKYEHTSLNGIMSAASFDKREVLNIEIFRIFCDTCTKNLPTQHLCKKDYDGYSGGMEVAGVLNTFESVCAVRCPLYRLSGDRDSKVYKKMVEHHGPTVKINKMECIGHVQKRMRSQLL